MPLRPRRERAPDSGSTSGTSRSGGGSGESGTTSRAETAGEEDFDEYHGDWQLRQKRPIGLRLGPDGSPVFPSKPGAWDSDLADDQKILWLFDEIRDLDTTETKRYAGLSYYRQAMLGRSRFGMDRLTFAASMYWVDGSSPLQEELEPFLPWELEDAEALVLAGGRIRKVTLPPQWDVFALLRTVVGDYAESGWAPPSQYAIGVYHQSRQQYRRAKTAYAEVAGDPWAERATEQVTKIEAPQVRINQTGVQLPGAPARVSLSHRNISKVHFVAREIDLEGFFREIREQAFDLEKGPRDVWALGQWHAWFTTQYSDDNFARQVAKRHVGAEIARWSDTVEDDGTHRYAQATLQTPLQGPGAYLVYAYLEEPDADDAKPAADPLKLGNSRAVVVQTDLALVEKNTKDGRLYFVADAESGAPVAGASVQTAEFWSVYQRQKRNSHHYREISKYTTNEEGQVLTPLPKRPNRGHVHVMVIAGEGKEKRMAWAGMRYWQGYHPSRMQEGLFAYCITDRPVYRPSQTVRSRCGCGDMDHGLFQEPQGRGFPGHDPRPARQPSSTRARKRSDAFGGHRRRAACSARSRRSASTASRSTGERYAGGQNFRVEEYKKPEFEVTVEPGETHAKLGEKLKAEDQGDLLLRRARHRRRR